MKLAANEMEALEAPQNRRVVINKKYLFGGSVFLIILLLLLNFECAAYNTEDNLSKLDIIGRVDIYAQSHVAEHDKILKNKPYYIWAKAKANLRDDCSVKSKVIDTVLFNQRLLTYGKCKSGWYVIKSNNKISYIREDLISNVRANKKNLGTFRASHYCQCYICCGKYSGMGITKSGAKLQAGKTIAVDPNVIPLGSKILVNGKMYIAQDIGGAIKGNRLDIYCGSHQEALSKGVKWVNVQLILD